MTMPLRMKDAAAEPDRFPIVEVDLRGRFMTPSRAEHPCEITAMSTSEIRLVTPADVNIGDRIVLYVSELGRFEGEVARREDDGFAIRMSLAKLKHAKLAEQLTWYGNRDTPGLEDMRGAERVVPVLRRATLRLYNGKELIVGVNDISLDAVSIETSVRTIVGSRCTVGERPATVSRAFDGGFVAKFETPFMPGELDEFTRL